MQITFEQDLLLCAIFEKGDQWIDSLRRWESEIEIDKLDAASFYLLPMLYRKLSLLAVHSLHHAKIQGVYRHTWANNQRKIKALKETLQLCAEIGVPTLLIKGSALLFTHYREKGLRYMADLDIVIPEEEISSVATHLAFRGYLLKGEVDAKKTLQNPKYRKIEHAVPFLNAAQEEIDLHWHVLDECSSREANRFFWEGSDPIEVGGCLTRSLNPADHLLLLSVHGFRWNPFPSLRWLMDVAVILEQSADRIDWERLAFASIRWNLTAPVEGVLSLLIRYGFHPPISCLDRLRGHPLSSHYAAEYAHRFKPKISRSDRLLHRWFLYSRRAPHHTFLQRLWRFPDYFKTLYGATNFFSLFWTLMKKMGK